MNEEKRKKKEEHQLLYKAAERQKMCSEAIQMLEYRKNGKQEMRKTEIN